MQHINHRYLKVSPQLGACVRTVLVLDDLPGSGSAGLPLYTNGTPALVFKTVAGNNRLTLFGQSVPNEYWTPEKDTRIVAFFFKPFAMAPVFKLPATRLKEKPVELNTWSPQKTMALNVQLLHAGSTEAVVEILDHFIAAQIQHNRRDCEMIQLATDRFMEQPGAETLAQMLAELHMTERTFQRLFKKYTGVTAGEYRRICQFYFAFSQLKGGHFNKLTDVAYANGYFDQSHYIRSFKEFTGATPNQYLQHGLPAPGK